MGFDSTVGSTNGSKAGDKRRLAQHMLLWKHELQVCLSFQLEAIKLYYADGVKDLPHLVLWFLVMW